MYLFLGILVFALIALPIVIRIESKRRAKVEQEKADGSWDFIDDEYMPYLGSHSEPVKLTDQLSMVIDHYDKWTLTGRLNYNAAGIYAEFDQVMDDAPKKLFIWGKDRPSKFCPQWPLFFHSTVRESDGRLILKLNTKENQSMPNYKLTIKNAPLELVKELRSALGEERV